MVSSSFTLRCPGVVFFVFIPFGISSNSSWIWCLPSVWNIFSLNFLNIILLILCYFISLYINCDIVSWPTFQLIIFFFSSRHVLLKPSIESLILIFIVFNSKISTWLLNNFHLFLKSNIVLNSLVLIIVANLNSCQIIPMYLSNVSIVGLFVFPWVLVKSVLLYALFYFVWMIDIVD